MKRVAILTVLLMSFAHATKAQSTFSGRAVEVIDGRTFVLEIMSGRIKVRLQHIEIPEPEQPLHKEACEHLRLLLESRVVEFRPLRIDEKLMVGRLMIGGIDIGVQMVRDGAAWHEPPAESGQSAVDAAEYAANEDTARIEKRGIWAYPGLRSPWQIREERLERERLRKQTEREAKPTLVGVNQFQSAHRGSSGATSRHHSGQRSEREVWADMFADRFGPAGGEREAYGLRTFSDPQKRFDAIYSSPRFLDLNGRNAKIRVECRLVYYAVKEPHPLGNEWYALYFHSINDDFHFSKRRSVLTVLADGRNLTLGVPYTGAKGSVSYGSHELFFYVVSRSQLSKIANAKKVEVRVEGMKAELDPETKDLFKQLSDTMR